MRLAKRRKVRPDDPVAVVTRFLDAANHHDADGLRACVHPEFESFQPLHPARNFRGSGQLISNWRAIFEAEPGFRLTLLRASTTGNTVWAEVHGAGASAEAAGIFIVGVEDARIRWIRVYSDLVEPLPEEPVEEPPEAGTPVDWDRDPIRLVPPRPAAEAEAAEGEEPEGEPAEGEEPAVAAAGGEPPGLRLVGADADAPEAVAPEAEADAGEESIEVLVGEAPEEDVEAGIEAHAPIEGEPPEAPAVPAPTPEEEEAVTAPAPAAADGTEAEAEDESVADRWDAVARLGAAGPEPSGDAPSDAPPSRRRRGFLRRGGAR